MAIELRIDKTDMGEIVVACVHCGEDVGDPREGFAVWMSDGYSDPGADTVLWVDYAHRGCEERFQERLSGPEQRVMKKINLPLTELFDALREPQAPEREDSSDRP